jgi:DNA (cytosine-5)-methyltransferase 1
MTLTVGSVCTGYSGLEQGLRLAGWDVRLAWVADNDPGAAKLLTYHYPDVPNLGDIARVDWAAVEPVDLLTAGYPCQPFSVAGLRKAEDDERHIWPTIADAIRLVRPRYVLLENVRGHVGRGFARVVARLASLGYVGSWVCVRASDVSAPHRRERLFCLATDATRLGHRNPREAIGGGVASATVGDAVRPGATDGVALLPTPAARLADKRGMPSVDTATTRMYDEGRRNLEDAVALLPTPAARDAGRGAGYADQPGRPLSETIMRLLPTPTAGDGAAGPGHSGREGGLNLRTEVVLLPGAVMLLPTPTATPYGNNQSSSAGAATNANGWTLSDVAHVDRWGQYAPAIARWERVLGRPAPDPTEPGKKGQPRLSSRFVEWMQGLPEGWVTDVPGLSRNDQLHLLGNGVVPLQCAAAAWILQDWMAP